ncbi:MAG: DNA adenine methylase [Treponema sp.]|jgi:DNA adenine methylase|nr:DNA adenine methylase [Treponema sp.]
MPAICLSYGSKLDGRFGYDRIGTTSKKMANKRVNFKADYAIRLQQAQIECCDAPRIIGSRDTPETFFYFDPPYVGADQGHYDSYTQMDFDALLEALESIQEKFLLISHRNTSLGEFTRRNGWGTVEIRLSSSMTHGQGRAVVRDKVEALAANYPISVKFDERVKKNLADKDWAKAGCGGCRAPLSPAFNSGLKVSKALSKSRLKHDKTG